MKISDKEFWHYVARAGGIMNKTAKMIEKEKKITFSRAAVSQRINRNKKSKAKYEEIMQSNADMAEDVVFAAIAASTSEKIRVDTAKWFLERKAKDRGYNVKDDTQVNISPVIVINDNMINNQNLDIPEI